MSYIFNKKFVNKNINKGEYGLEMESLRIDKNGYLPHTKHPFVADKHIDRDFSENQIEMINDVCFSVDELYDSIKTLRSDVMNKLKNLFTIKNRFEKYFSFWQDELSRHNYTLTGTGINPHRQYNRNVPIPNERYRMLFHHLGSYKRYTDLPIA